MTARGERQRVLGSVTIVYGFASEIAPNGLVGDSSNEEEVQDSVGAVETLARKSGNWNNNLRSNAFRGRMYIVKKFQC